MKFEVEYEIQCVIIKFELRIGNSVYKYETQRVKILNFEFE